MKTITASLSILFLTLLNGGAMANDLIKTGQRVYLADSGRLTP